MWLRIKCFVWSPTARIRLSTEWLRAGAKKNFSHVLLFFRKYFNLEPCLFSVWRHIFSTNSNKPNHANIYMFLLCSVRPFLSHSSLNQYVNSVIRIGRSFFYVIFVHFAVWLFLSGSWRLSMCQMFKKDFRARKKTSFTKTEKRANDGNDNNNSEKSKTKTRDVDTVITLQLSTVVDTIWTYKLNTKHSWRGQNAPFGRKTLLFL